MMTGGALTRLSLILLQLASCRVYASVNVYCKGEWFNATCPRGEAVLMTSARYGRYEINRCVESDTYLGCGTSALDVMDTLCSGRPRCSVRLPDWRIHERMTCPKDTLGSLDAAYECVPVVQASERECRRKPIEVSYNSVAYLSSFIGYDEHTTRNPCQYRITVTSGLLINFTLIDFGLFARSNTTSSTCVVYGNFEERSRQTSITLCGPGQRVKALYVSETNQVLVDVRVPSPSTTALHYLIKFEAIECPKLEAPAGGWVQRTGLTQATLGCNYTEQKWYIVCSKSKWQGERENCSSTLPNKDTDHQDLDANFPFGLFIAVITGIVLGVLIGIAMLGVVFCVQKRRKEREGSSHSPPTRSLDLVSPDSPFLQKSCDISYGYTHVWPTLRNHPARTNFCHDHVPPSAKHNQDREGTMRKPSTTPAAAPAQAPAPAPAPKVHVDQNKTPKHSLCDRGVTGMHLMQVRVSGDKSALEPTVDCPMYEDYTQGQDMTLYDVADHQGCHHHHQRQTQRGDSQLTDAIS